MLRDKVQTILSSFFDSHRILISLFFFIFTTSANNCVKYGESENFFLHCSLFLKLFLRLVQTKHEQRHHLILPSPFYFFLNLEERHKQPQLMCGLQLHHHLEASFVSPHAAASAQRQFL